MYSRRDFLRAAAVVNPFAPWLGVGSHAASAAVRFAVLSDVQYADKDTAGRREYRSSLDKLSVAVHQIPRESPMFTIHLGDLVDGGAENADRIARVYEQLPGRKYHVLGNHDFYGSREQVLKRFGLRRGYYAFRISGWQFVALDGMDISVKGGWPEHGRQAQLGAKILGELRERRTRNANDWNGAIGEQQRAWLKGILGQANRRGERSIVFCHFPVLAAACRPDHLLWDHEEVLNILDTEPTVAAYLCGHDHNGGYAERNGVHYITMAGVVENDLDRCLRIVEATPTHLLLRRPGDRDGQVLELGRRA